MEQIVCKIAENDAEYADYLAVRYAVFVEEQRLFAETDIDEYDEIAIPIIAVDPQNGAVVGAVRCYPVGDDVWYGGRLAVMRRHRHSAAAIGATLCRVAEATVIAKGCRQFLAYIQQQNVPFFERLEWRAIGDLTLHHGHPHQLMAASLAAARFDESGAASPIEQVAHV